MPILKCGKHHLLQLANDIVRNLIQWDKLSYTSPLTQAVENLEIFWLKPQAHRNIRSNLNFFFFFLTHHSVFLSTICSVVNISTAYHQPALADLHYITLGDNGALRFIGWKCLHRHDVWFVHNNTWQIVKLMPCILTKDSKRHVNQPLMDRLSALRPSAMSDLAVNVDVETKHRVWELQTNLYPTWLVLLV